jgi:hypothetical protein
MAVPSIRSLNMQDIKSFGNLARTNLFQVTIDGVGNGNGDGQSFSTFLTEQSQRYGISQFSSGFKDQLSVLCYEASLPTSSYATAEVKDNFMGVPQEFAHTRITTDIDFSFYIDRDYKVLMFFEAWMDYIAGTGAAQLQSNGSPTPYNQYYRRFHYPDNYKTDNLYIKKFERDWSTPNAPNVSYQFINSFPKNVTSIPITYGEAEILKVTVTMNYDRYIMRREYAPLNIEQQQSAFEQNLLNATSTQIPGTTIFGLSGSATGAENNQNSINIANEQSIA